MSWSNSIRVVDEDGDPVEGCKVYISFGIWNGHDTQYTDEDGWAEFEYDNIDKDEMIAEMIAIGSDVVDEDTVIENGETRSYTF